MIRQTGSLPAGLSPENCRPTLKRRAQALASVRRYFASEEVLEVETPLLRKFAVTDPQLENMRVEKPFAKGDWLYLQTSPEYAMKQLLAKNSGSIYQLGKAFRCDPIGRFHSQEFSLLEWYRVDFSLSELIDDVVAVVAAVLDRPCHKELISYRDAFLKYVDIDPFSAPLEALRQRAQRDIDIDASDLEKDFWLDLLLTHCVEPELGKNGCLTFLTDYPKSQAALAKLKQDLRGNIVADRFELYIDGMELANGYSELTAAADYRERFIEDNQRRRRLELPQVELDGEFLDAMVSGIPACSGVALGFDRLMLLAL